MQPAQRPSRGPRAEGRTIMEAALPPPRDGDRHGLIRSLRQREEDAFRELLDRHETAMLRVAMSHVGSRARAEEVVQDTWLAVIDGIDGFRGESSLKTWLFRILQNRARRCATREARTIPFSDARPSPDDEPGEPIEQRISADDRNAWTGWLGPGPEERALDLELRSRIEDAIRRLPPRQRTVVMLHDVEACPPDEVRTRLGLSAGNQRVLLHRGRARVRELLAPLVTEEAAGHRPQATASQDRGRPRK